MGELALIPNIGKELEKQLNMAGIFTYSELKQEGAKNAWLKIQKFDSSACIHRLMSLEGAVERIKKSLIADEKRPSLKNFTTLIKNQKFKVKNRKAAKMAFRFSFQFTFACSRLLSTASNTRPEVTELYSSGT